MPYSVNGCAWCVCVRPLVVISLKKSPGRSSWCATEPKSHSYDALHLLPASFLVLAMGDGVFPAFSSALHFFAHYRQKAYIGQWKSSSVNWRTVGGVLRTVLWISSYSGQHLHFSPSILTRRLNMPPLNHLDSKNYVLVLFHRKSPNWDCPFAFAQLCLFCFNLLYGLSGDQKVKPKDISGRWTPR